MQLCIIFPAKDEEETIGRNVKIAKKHTDLVYVVDNCSKDKTALEARKNGAEVIDASERQGKGWAMKKGIERALELDVDAVMFLDADLESLCDEWILKLCNGLKEYDRVQSNVWRKEGDGLVTQFTAKPLLANLFPELDHIDQPLIGEWVAKKRVFQMLPIDSLPDNWGIDISLLIWTHLLGFSIGQVYLGKRLHTSTRDYTTEYLSKMAKEVARAVLNFV